MLPVGLRVVWLHARVPGCVGIHGGWCRLAHSSGSDDSMPKTKSLLQKTDRANKDKFGTHSVASVMDIFLNSNEDLIERLSKALGSKMESTPRPSLRSRLETLESVGCTLNQIQTHPEILRLAETEVLQRTQRLHNIGAPISVELLRSAVVKCPVKLQQRVAEVCARDDFLRQTLECSQEELAVLKEKLPFLQLVMRQHTLARKVETLARHGMSLEDVKSQPTLLCRSPKVLARRLKKLHLLKKAGKLEEYPMYWLILSEKNFSGVVRRHLEARARSAKVQSQMETILGLPKEEVSSFSKNINLLSPSQVKKVNYLIEVGVPREEIVNHIYLLNSSFSRLQQAVQQARDAGVDPPSAIFLISIIHHRRIPLRSSPPRQLMFLAELLDTDIDKLQRLGNSVQLLGSVDKVTLRKNLAFFKSQGFSLEDVRACPLVLMHHHDSLTVYFKTLSEVPEFQPFEEVARDKARYLNLLQYAIERDMNFGCNVLHADVEEEEVTKDIKVTES